jgi:sulfur carrier protein
MKLRLNGKYQEFNQETINLVDLLLHAGIAKPELVSVQVNGNFIKREDFASTVIKNSEEVDFLFFMGGGSSQNLDIEQDDSNNIKVRRASQIE